MHFGCSEHMHCPRAAGLQTRACVDELRTDTHGGEIRQYFAKSLPHSTGIVPAAHAHALYQYHPSVSRRPDACTAVLGGRTARDEGWYACLCPLPCHPPEVEGRPLAPWP